MLPDSCMSGLPRCRKAAGASNHEDNAMNFAKRAHFSGPSGSSCVVPAYKSGNNVFLHIPNVWCLVACMFRNTELRLKEACPSRKEELFPLLQMDDLRLLEGVESVFVFWKTMLFCRKETASRDRISSSRKGAFSSPRFSSGKNTALPLLEKNDPFFQDWRTCA